MKHVDCSWLARGGRPRRGGLTPAAGQGRNQRDPCASQLPGPPLCPAQPQHRSVTRGDPQGHPASTRGGHRSRLELGASSAGASPRTSPLGSRPSVSTAPAVCAAVAGYRSPAGPVVRRGARGRTSLDVRSACSGRCTARSTTTLTFIEPVKHQGWSRAPAPPVPTPIVTPSTSTDRSWPVRTVSGRVSSRCLPIRPSSGSSIG